MCEGQRAITVGSVRLPGFPQERGRGQSKWKAHHAPVQWLWNQALSLESQLRYFLDVWLPVVIYILSFQFSSSNKKILITS